MKSGVSRWVWLVVVTGCAGGTPEAGVDDAGGLSRGGTDVGAASDGETATETEPAPEPYDVGFVTRTIDGPDGTQLHTIFWYPTRGPFPHLVPEPWFGVIVGHAFPEVKAVGGPWPVLLFSHGSQAINFQSVDLCEAWARGGYVVVAPNHVGNMLLDQQDDDDKARVGIRRPKDLVAALAAVEALNAEEGGVLEGRVDLERVGVAGHSFGGLTALVAAGAHIDVVGARARCDAGVDMKGACAMLDRLGDGPLWDGRPAELDGIRAGIAISPAIWGLFGEAGLAQVTAPVFIGAGARDTITPVAEHAEPIFAALPHPRALAMFPDAGHYGFSNFCDIPDIETLTAGVIAECGEGFIDHFEAMAALAELTLPWLDAHVGGDPNAIATLEARIAGGRWGSVAEVIVEN